MKEIKEKKIRNDRSDYMLCKSGINYKSFNKLFKSSSSRRFIDLKGRCYLLTNKNEFNDSLLLKDKNENNTQEIDLENKEKAIFYIQLPIRLKGNVNFPSSERENVFLYSLSDSKMYMARTNGLSDVGPNTKTAMIKLIGITSYEDDVDTIYFHKLTTKKDHHSNQEDIIPFKSSTIIGRT